MSDIRRISDTYIDVNNQILAVAVPRRIISRNNEPHMKLAVGIYRLSSSASWHKLLRNNTRQKIRYGPRCQISLSHALRRLELSSILAHRQGRPTGEAVNQVALILDPER